MYKGILDLHSLLRYVVLALLLFSIIRAFSGWLGKQAFTPAHKKSVTFTVISAHIQLLTGIVLYFISDMVTVARSNMGEAMKDKVLRFWSVEHLSMMIIAIALITVGSSLSKKAADDTGKHKKIALFFTIALIIILASIPWPFMQVGTGRGWI